MGLKQDTPKVFWVFLDELGSSLNHQLFYNGVYPGSSDGKESTAIQETQVQSLGQEDPLEKGMATHSSILTWRIPWTEEPGRL